jgi:hypothetical protein
MLPESKYVATGACIYCGEEKTPLTKEHVIPDNLNGNITLPQASCLDCQIEIGRYEDFCAKNIFNAARAHLGFKSQTNRAAKRVREIVDLGTGKAVDQRIPLSDHSGMMVLFVLPPPAAFPPHNPPDLFGTIDISIIPIIPNFSVRNPPEKPLDIFVLSENKIQLVLQLAKIGHCYATYRLGVGGFKPTLADLVIGRSKMIPVDLTGDRLMNGNQMEN